MCQDKYGTTKGDNLFQFQDFEVILMRGNPVDNMEGQRSKTICLDNTDEAINVSRQIQKRQKAKLVSVPSFREDEFVRGNP